MTGNKQDGVHSSGLLTRLGLMTAILIVVSSMIGSGIFKKAAPMAADLESGGLLLLCWVIAGLITMIGAVTNAEIAGLIAAPGGQYVYFKEMYGKAFAFIYGWSCFSVIQSASIASIAYVFSESVNAILPLPHLSTEMESFSILGIFYPFASFGVKVLTIATIIFLTVANYLGVIFGGIINNIFTSLKVLGILIIITLGLTMSGGSVENVSPIGPNPSAEYGTSLGLFGAMFAAMLGAFWAMTAGIISDISEAK